MLGDSQGPAAFIDADQLSVFNDVSAVPTLYVDGVQGFMSTGPNIKINFYEIIQDIGGTDPSGVKKVIVARLAMPLIVAQQIGAWLTSSAASAQVGSEPGSDGNKKQE